MFHAMIHFEPVVRYDASEKTRLFVKATATPLDVPIVLLMQNIKPAMFGRGARSMLLI